MSDIINGNKFDGDKVEGNKYEINSIDLDIGILKEILELNPNLIKEYLTKLNSSEAVNNPDERTIPIEQKNLHNGLEDFYENFIKRVEQKLALLDQFFKDNDYIDEIEEAADSIKIFINTYANRNSMILEPMIFNIIIQEHTKSIEITKNKSIMKLVIFYLYRYCYIGCKNA